MAVMIFELCYDSRYILRNVGNQWIVGRNFGQSVHISIGTDLYCCTDGPHVGMKLGRQLGLFYL